MWFPNELSSLAEVSLHYLAYLRSACTCFTFVSHVFFLALKGDWRGSQACDVTMLSMRVYICSVNVWINWPMFTKLPLKRAIGGHCNLQLVFVTMSGASALVPLGPRLSAAGRSVDWLQPVDRLPCNRYNTICCSITETYNIVINVLTYNFSKEQNVLTEDDLRIETCRRVLSVLMKRF